MKPIEMRTRCEHWLCDQESTFVIHLHKRTDPLMGGEEHPMCKVHIMGCVRPLLDALALDEDATGITIVYA